MSEGMKNFLLLICTLLIGLLLAELTVRALGSAKEHMKTTLFHGKTLDTTSFAHCYTSNPHNIFPLHLKNQPKQAQKLKELFHLEDRKLKFLRDKSPHCIVYQLNARKMGTNLKSNKEIVLIGDSFTFGEGLPENHTLAQILYKKYPQYNFRNYGRSGTNVRDILEITQKLLWDKKVPKAKHFIYFYNLNDIILSNEMSKSQQRIVNDLQNIRFRNVKSRYVEPKEDFITQSHLFKLIRKVLMLRKDTKNTVENYLDMYFAAKNQSGMKDTFQNLEELNNLFIENKLKFTVVFYPLMYKQAGKYPFQKAHDKMLNKCKQLKLHCIDAAKAFSKEKSMRHLTVHPIDYHPNLLANQKVVDFLYKNDKLNLNHPTSRPTSQPKKRE